MKNSSHDEFLKWYEPIHDRFARYCRSKALALTDTEDLMQEAILSTLQAWYRIREKEKLLGFMIGVVNHLVSQAIRRQRFKGDWDEKALDHLESLTGDPEAALDIQFLLKAIQRLPASQREAVTLFELSGFTIREISEIQQTSEGAVKTRLSRGRQRLKEILSDDRRPAPLAQRLAMLSSILF